MKFQLQQNYLLKRRQASQHRFKGDKLEGESLSLNCDFETDSDLAGNIRVTWFKDCKLLEGESKIEIFLNDLKYDDTGDYKCLIKTEVDEAEQIHTLVVYKKTAVEVPEVFADKKSVTGKEVELECTIVTDPKLRKSLNITWLKDQEFIGPGEIFWGSEFDATSTLKLGNVTESDSGKYACSASTWLDSSVIEVGALSVWKAASFLTSPSAVEVIQGGKSMLDCEVDVDPELMDNLVITWAKDGEIIDITQGGEGNFRMEENNTLTIFSANEESSGSYTCQVSTDLDSENLVQNLKVLEKNRIVEHPRHLTVKQGDSFELECAISTDPELLSSLMISWRHNKMDMAVASGGQNQVMGKSSLLLVADDATVGGRYDCVAVTRLDSVESRGSYVKVDGMEYHNCLALPI